MTLLVISIAIVAGLAGLWAYRRSTAAPRSRAHGRSDDKVASKAQAEQFGVRIAAASKERACPQVRPLLGKEFLMADRPNLPLHNCPYPQQCECRYIPLMDRRKGERRSGQERRELKRFEKDRPDRRSGTDRRKTGVDWDTHGL